MRNLEKGHSVKELFPVYFLQGIVAMGGREGRKILLLLYSPYLCMVLLHLDLSPNRKLNYNILNTTRLLILFRSKSQTTLNSQNMICPNLGQL